MEELRPLFCPQSDYLVDRAFYDDVRSADRQLLERFVISPFSGRGFIVKRGQSFRVIQEEGPQVADVAFWNEDNPEETLSCLRTWEVDGWFLKVYSRLWSDVPWLRPMVTCVEDTVDTSSDGQKAPHHFVASHCSPEQQEMRSGRAGLNACRVNLLAGHRALRAGLRKICGKTSIYSPSSSSIPTPASSTARAPTPNRVTTSSFMLRWTSWLPYRSVPRETIRRWLLTPYCRWA